MTRIRLGILQTNHDKSAAVGDAFPDDAHRFRDLFDGLEQRFSYRIYMTVGGEVPADPAEQDAWLITGSPLSVLDDLAFLPPLYDFIRRADAARARLVGACFGHQAIAMALGGRVERVKWNVGIETHRLTARHDWMHPPRDSLNLYTFHHDAVTTLPRGCEVLAETEACPIAGFTKGSHILTTQAHPEFTDPFMRCVLDASRPVLDSAAQARADDSLSRHADGSVFAQWTTRFFGGTP